MAQEANRPDLLIKTLASSRRSGKMLVNEHPARAALLPNPRVPEFHLSSLTVFRFFRQMHRHRRPRDRPAAVHFQILARRQLDLRRALKELLLYAVVVLLPAVIRKGRHVIENQSVILGVELRWGLRVSGTPSGAIAVDELAKRGVVSSLLLRPSTNKSQQPTNDRQHNIQQPAPLLGMIAGSSAHGSRHSVSPGNPGTRVCRWRLQRVPPTLLRICPFCKRSYSRSFTKLILVR